MKVLYVGPYHDYGFTERGPSWDYYNIERSLQIYDKWNTKFFHPDKSEFDDTIGNWKPNVIIENYFQDQFEIPDALLQKARNIGTLVVRWDNDSQKRYDHILAKHNRYPLYISMDPRMGDWYRANFLSVIATTFAAGPEYFPLSSIKKDIDVSFIGQPYGFREEYLSALLTAGIEVKIFGRGWLNDWSHNEYRIPLEFKYLDFYQMIDVIRRSKICLNFANTHTGGARPLFPSNIKGRHFEIPACRTCQITTPVEGIEEYFEPDKEIVIANDKLDLINKVKKMLQDDASRESIANASYERVEKEHRWNHRFDYIDQQIREFLNVVWNLEA